MKGIGSETLSGGAVRHWYSGLGLSTAVHLAGIAFLAGVFVRADNDAVETSIDTRWRQAREKAPRFEAARDRERPVSAEAGGERSAVFAVATEIGSRPDASVSLRDETLLAPETDDVFSSEILAQDVGGLFVDGSGASAGNGEGVGDGTGSGEGFFGITAAGQRFVYVVDCSTSMNYTHDSPAKTRFKRLKLELVKSIGGLDSSQDFYIIFFNQDAMPMPAAALQPAYPKLKKRYLKWMAGIRARGDTDPRDAMRLALRLNPDVIYLLTDGEFTPLAIRDFRKLRQRRVAIHTFALGNSDGEEILKLIARQNGGEYHFVP